jgi:threonine/homoserine/homoserine lactone efflux protein
MSTDLLRRPWVAPLAIVAAIVFAVIGLMYAAAFGISSVHHPKHAILFFVLAAGAGVIAWFSLGARRGPTAARTVTLPEDAP